MTSHFIFLIINLILDSNVSFDHPAASQVPMVSNICALDATEADPMFPPTISVPVSPSISDASRKLGSGHGLRPETSPMVSVRVMSTTVFINYCPFSTCLLPIAQYLSSKMPKMYTCTTQCLLLPTV